MSLWRLAPAWAPPWGGGAPTLAAASRGLRGRIDDQRTFLAFVLAVGATNVASLLGNALAFRWVDPASMGIWHTLLVASSYLTVVRLGLINGMGRELPFALGSGDIPRARRIAATSWRSPSSSRCSSPAPPSRPGGWPCPPWRW
jgi:hypothetical protein